MNNSCFAIGNRINALGAVIVVTALSARPGLAEPAHEIQRPFSQGIQPLEGARLSTYADLQVALTSTDSTFGKLTSVGVALEGAYDFSDAFQLGLNVPILVNDMLTPTQLNRGADFGNITLLTKLKLFGNSRGPVVGSLFLNTTFPTTTEDIGTRAFFTWKPGFAIAGTIANLVTLGGATGVKWTYIDKMTDLGLFYTDLYSAVRLHRLIGFQLGLQLDVSINNSTGDRVSAVFSPMVQLFPIGGMHIDLGARIAASDPGRALISGGRAMFAAAVGWDF